LSAFVQSISNLFYQKFLKNKGSLRFAASRRKVATYLTLVSGILRMGWTIQVVNFAGYCIMKLVELK
jgi:hypothetical protein